MAEGKKMIFEFVGVCRFCAEEVSILVNNGELLGRCVKCGESPFEIKKFKGLIYVVSNPNQRGVKIGMTTKSVEARVKTLNGTGVPGSFSPIVIFPSDRPKRDEKKIHEKIARKRIAKEHFELSPLEAALKCYRVLNKRNPIFYDNDVRERFFLQLESDKIQMQIKLKGNGPK